MLNTVMANPEQLTNVSVVPLGWNGAAEVTSFDHCGKSVTTAIHKPRNSIKKNIGKVHWERRN